MLFSIDLIGEPFDVVLVDAAVGDVVGVGEPDIVEIITDELGSHSQNLDLTHLLKVVAHLKALHVGILLELSTFKQAQLVLEPELLVADLTCSTLIVGLIERGLELNGDVIRSGLRVSLDTRLDVLDHLRRVVAVGHPKLLDELSETTDGNRLQLLEVACVWITGRALWCSIVLVVEVVLEANPGEPVITVLLLRVIDTLLRTLILLLFVRFFLSFHSRAALFAKLAASLILCIVLIYRARCSSLWGHSVIIVHG